MTTIAPPDTILATAGNDRADDRQGRGVHEPSTNQFPETLRERHLELDPRCQHQLIGGKVRGNARLALRPARIIAREQPALDLGFR
ncbi:hypothetical protein [Thiocapsa rosea]|uniref:Uncharacterized protein n=1 Tax=Thiocapsa rosea TaxID=69360 RepID=A0A495VAZ2_9GAMM|nr:hypothetical protein [Thiocapsa rosea]RKT45803.1 hypothetical protein BDD21_3279 [Thiocapsa rosea]